MDIIKGMDIMEGMDTARTDINMDMVMAVMDTEEDTGDTEEDTVDIKIFIFIKIQYVLMRRSS